MLDRERRSMLWFALSSLARGYERSQKKANKTAQNLSCENIVGLYWSMFDFPREMYWPAFGDDESVLPPGSSIQNAELSRQASRS